jgi:putative endonuclease
MWPFSRKAPTDASTPSLRRRPLSGDRAALGRLGEKLARKSLKRLGWKILAENYRCPSGEIDLIALDPTTSKTLQAQSIVFVEVKTRSPGQLAAPQAAVHAAKQRQIRAAAAYYLRTHDAEGFAIRYDIVAIVDARDGQPAIEHIRGAFE